MPFFSPIWARGPRVTWLHHVHTEMWPMVLPQRLARAGQILERRLAPLFYRRELIVTLSESSRLPLLDRLGFRPDNVHVVPPGIAPSFSVAGNKTPEPKTPEPKTPEPSVVAVGRLMPVKAFDELIEAVRRVREVVPASLAIIGEGYERDSLERLIAHHQAEEWCELVGRVHENTLIERYRSAWVVASTSKSEGWGMTLTEAAACGTPAVATRISGHTDAVEDGVTGLLVDSPSEFVEALLRMLGDSDFRDRMGAQARRRSASYTWERTAYDTMAVLAADARRRPRNG